MWEVGAQRAGSNVKLMGAKAEGAEDFITAKSNTIKYILFSLIDTCAA